ncbi:MAG: substrate-binding domain-containing protein, partial [Bacteroides sp.]|nr:substrate-binding domain-containing protein [Bacteroides sp.]
MAAVSAGTVDRVLHNRGDVSPESRKRVEDVLASINYTPKLHSVTPKEERQIRLLVILPQHNPGEYWEQIENGIEKAFAQFSRHSLKIRYLYYDQFDVYSCRKIFKEALTLKKDGVIIGPSFYDETVLFSNQLYMKSIPYVFVDTPVSNTEPLAIFAPHSYHSGMVQAKLLTTILKPGKDIALFQARRIGDEMSIQSLARQHGFLSWLKENDFHSHIHFAQYDKSGTPENEELMNNFFRNHTNVGAAVVFNTRAYIISEYLKRHRIHDIRLVGFGTNAHNIHYLKEGYISYLIAERPEYQGYMAVKTVLEY